MNDSMQTNPEILLVLKQFFEAREGQGALEEIGDTDLIDSGWLDSLDLVELATLVSESAGRAVDLTKEAHFNSMRSIRGIVEFSSSP